MKITGRIISLGLLVALLAGCAAQPAAPDAEATRAFEAALLTATHALLPASPTPSPHPPATQTPAPSLTPTPEPSPTVARTPPDLPPGFVSAHLNPLDAPQAYIEDTCQYLKMRWDANSAEPGTVVMPIMFHSITGDDKPLANEYAIHHSDLVIMLEHAREVGFETITSAQLVDFLYHNAKIPRRSLILIQDDRPPGAFRLAFGPFLDEYGWTLTWAWPIADTDTKRASKVLDEQYGSLWEQMEAYFATGKLDMQAHGWVHNIPIGPNSSDEYIRSEMGDARDALRAHFYCKGQEKCDSDQPLAYIWAGGGFSRRGAEIGRELGYKIGFTTHPRGPIMFNWIPQADALDPARPYWVPEGPAGDPLMTLPRYWSTDAAYRIDEVGNIGEEAAAYAAANRAVELEYYDIVCKPLTGEIPGLKP